MFSQLESRAVLRGRQTRHLHKAPMLLIVIRGLGLLINMVTKLQINPYAMGPMKTKNVYARESPRARNQTALLEQMCRQESQQSNKSEPGESFKGHKKQTNSCSFLSKVMPAMMKPRFLIECFKRQICVVQNNENDNFFILV